MKEIENLLKKEFGIDTYSNSDEIHIKVDSFDEYIIREIEEYGDFEELEIKLISIIEKIREMFDIDIDYVLDKEEVVLEIII
jgi:hypothetical protein|nr:MAG TPA: hypothetical protein [Caudoviricetes sp.]